MVTIKSSLMLIICFTLAHESRSLLWNTCSGRQSTQQQEAVSGVIVNECLKELYPFHKEGKVIKDGKPVEVRNEEVKLVNTWKNVKCLKDLVMICAQLSTVENTGLVYTRKKAIIYALSPDKTPNYSPIKAYDVQSCGSPLADSITIVPKTNDPKVIQILAVNWDGVCFMTVFDSNSKQIVKDKQDCLPSGKRGKQNTDDIYTNNWMSVEPLF